MLQILRKLSHEQMEDPPTSEVTNEDGPERKGHQNIDPRNLDLFRTGGRKPRTYVISLILSYSWMCEGTVRNNIDPTGDPYKGHTCLESIENQILCGNVLKIQTSI